MRNVYIIFPYSTGTIAKIARFFTKYPYTHMSVCIDDDLEVFYSFSRYRNDTALISGFAKEYRSHLTGTKDSKLKCKIFKLAVESTEYDDIEHYIHELSAADDILFNYLSVATFPLVGGFDVYKTENCCSFVAKVLEKVSYIDIDRPYCKYLPKDIEHILKDYVLLEGELDTDLEYDDDTYFYKTSFSEKIAGSVHSLRETFYRLVFKRKSKNFRKYKFKGLK